MADKHTSCKPFSNIELSSFSGQLALILKSGISVIEGLTIMQEDASSVEEREILKGLLHSLRETGSLSRAFEEAGLFPSYFVHMTAIAEETGTLDTVMEALAAHYDREDSIQRTIKSAVTYPLLMAGMMAIVILILVVKVLPIFNQVFIQLGTEMRGMSRVLMNLGNTISRYSILLTVLLVLFMAGLLFCTRTARGRALLRSTSSHFKFSRVVYESMAVCRFASGMALTLKSGFNPERSMELVSSLNEDPLFEKKLALCRHKLEEGEDLALALHSAGIFTGVCARMASIGSKTGSMDQIMEQIAGLYQDEIDTRMNNSLAVLEPTLVIALSLITGIILLSVMLPLTGVLSSI